MDRKTFLELLEKHRNGTASEEERQFLDVYYRLFEKDRDVLRQLSEDDRGRLKERIKRGIDGQIAQNKPLRQFKPYWYYAAAAAVILSLFIFLYKPASLEQNHIITQQDSIVPGKNTATLVLESGKEITLSDLHKGIVIGDLIKYDDGQVVSPAIAGQMLTLKTPRGGQYELTLPDGTRVWLNAGSSLRYPVHFGKEERRVFLEGEAYFDVAKVMSRDQNGLSHKVPFRVQAGAQIVDVLGTQFNISAYTDDHKTLTTLIEGSVNVLVNDKTDGNEIKYHVLKPGQQSVLKGQDLMISTVDVRQFTAWKYGKFVFEQEPLENILKMLARWYDVEIIYQGDASSVTFTGSVGRYEHISEILDKISYTQAVRFEIEGRRVKVM
ncbi:FecR family protein [Sphingobacterium corticibacterium]|uniref:FecR family protein n=1 Tax=Sphingobacterium corticibacterium TaxID=2484746 RepID=A0A4V2DCN9_9SPHI|nr:FecR family protein [Sphingobacterium corticibacterium]RZF62148.1 FecR family protein [Sphingobacterium corticibacterium]